jgi:hypothetical protein
MLSPPSNRRFVPTADWRGPLLTSGLNPGEAFNGRILVIGLISTGQSFSTSHIAFTLATKIEMSNAEPKDASRRRPDFPKEVKLFTGWGLGFAEKTPVNRILKPITYLLAAVYFVVDAAFIPFARRVSDWLSRHLVLRKLRAWIRSLRPYPSLALFSVPVIILEPVKPVAAYLAATGQVITSLLTLIMGELLKLVLVERLFSLTRDKLMKIPAFAWAYSKFRQAKAWLEATEAWRTVRSLSEAARNYLKQMKASGAVLFRQS